MLSSNKIEEIKDSSQKEYAVRWLPLALSMTLKMPSLKTIALIGVGVSMATRCIALRFSNENLLGSGPLQDNAKGLIHFVYKM